MSGLLQRHGTKLYELKPINVLQAAEADLNLRARKDDADDETPRELQRAWYSFHRYHVRKANSPAELLSLAQRERQVGMASGKPNTRLLYGDETLLQAALEIAS
jgi:hypothetical protein